MSFSRVTACTESINSGILNSEAPTVRPQTLRIVSVTEIYPRLRLAQIELDDWAVVEYSDTQGQD